MELVVSVAVAVTFETVTSTSIWSVELKDVETRVISAVFDDAVTVEGLTVGLNVAPVPPVVAWLIDNDSVTPVGILLKVSLICEPLGAGELLFELCVAVRQHEAQPSVIVNDPLVLAMLLFVKIEAVPWEVLPESAPTARPLVAMPGFNALMIVPLLVDKK